MSLSRLRIGFVERAIAVDGDSLELTMRRPVVIDGAMLRDAVVPEGDRVGTPAEAAAEAVLLHVLVEECEQLVRLGLADAEYAGGEQAVDEE